MTTPLLPKMAALKPFITRDRDAFVRPFGRTLDKSYRRTVFFGISNDTQYLQDDENRRFWTVQVNSIKTYHNIDLDQLWAEVVVMYPDGITWWLDEQQLTIVNTLNRAFINVHPFVEKLLAAGLRPATDDDTNALWLNVTAKAKYHQVSSRSASQRPTR